jgi:putative DNA primase/helicase
VVENVSSASLQSLTNSRFGLANIVDKLANVGDDIPATRVEDSSAFKKIVSGVRMEAEEKHRQSFPFIPTARLIFTANRVPDSVDDTDAWFDRWIVIPCERVFRGERGEIKRDDLIERMTTPTELSGFLNRAVSGLRRLEERGGFRDTVTTKRMKERMVEATESSASRFLRECCVCGEGGSVGKTSAWQSYRRWCDDLGEEKPSRRDWNSAVEEMPGVRENRNTGQRIWMGIALNASGERYRWMDDDIGFGKDGFCRNKTGKDGF